MYQPDRKKTTNYVRNDKPTEEKKEGQIYTPTSPSIGIGRKEVSKNLESEVKVEYTNLLLLVFI